ncbi:MAG: hypothetical protein LBT32_01250 [Peptococcaceae bacterium]|jgi:hypothetical protein|nr:hypothetical protein [Peptococcaceae bacterium]
MSNFWSKPPRKRFWQDVQGLAVCLVIIGMIGYFIFPSFIKNFDTDESTPASSIGSGNASLPPSGNYSLNPGTYDPADLYSPNNWYTSPDNLYGANTYQQNNAITTGYWTIIAQSGGFREIPLSAEEYAFLLNLIQNDQKASSQNPIFLAANGQIQKAIISDEILNILNNMALIDDRKIGTSPNSLNPEQKLSPYGEQDQP